MTLKDRIMWANRLDDINMIHVDAHLPLPQLKIAYANSVVYDRKPTTHTSRDTCLDGVYMLMFYIVVWSALLLYAYCIDNLTVLLY